MAERIEYPPHMRWRGGGSAIVGPLVRFRGQQVPVTSSPPRDTLDPRWADCTDHHLACDCREADQNELINELRSEWERLRRSLVVELEGHQTEVWWDGEQRPDLECKCQLCAFARANGLTPRENQSRRYGDPMPF